MENKYPCVEPGKESGHYLLSKDQWKVLAKSNYDRFLIVASQFKAISKVCYYKIRNISHIAVLITRELYKIRTYVLIT